jgi:hypothetical protein
MASARFFAPAKLSARPKRSLLESWERYVVAAGQGAVAERVLIKFARLSYAFLGQSAHRLWHLPLNRKAIDIARRNIIGCFKAYPGFCLSKAVGGRIPKVGLCQDDDNKTACSLIAAIAI